MQSLRMSRDQGAGSWELRTATDLAKLWADQDRSTEARELLRPIFERLMEGRDTLDLKAAAEALERLARRGDDQFL